MIATMMSSPIFGWWWYHGIILYNDIAGHYHYHKSSALQWPQCWRVISCFIHVIPVTNLLYLSKMKVVQIQMVAHLNATNAMPKTQLAYRQFHRMDTARLKVFSDIATTIDSGHVTALCLLDLSVAFDTVDHEILLARLEKTYGFITLTIKWLWTYLENRVFHVQLNAELYMRALIIDQTHLRSPSGIGAGATTICDIHGTTWACPGKAQQSVAHVCRRQWNLHTLSSFRRYDHSIENW